MRLCSTQRNITHEGPLHAKPMTATFHIKTYDHQRTILAYVAAAHVAPPHQRLSGPNHVHALFFQINDLAVENFSQIMGRPPPDAPGLPASLCRFYCLIGQKCTRASVFHVYGHPRASVSRNVVVEGHPFSQNGHPRNQNTILRGHQTHGVSPLKILKF